MSPTTSKIVLLKCVEKEPCQRYPSCGEVGEDLRCFLNHEPIKACQIGPLEQMVRWARRNPALAGSLSFAVLALLIGTIVSVVQAEEARHHAKQAQQPATKGAEQKQIADGKAVEAREEGNRAEQARHQAKEEKAIALAVRDIMQTRLLRQARPWEHARWAFAGTDRNPSRHSDAAAERQPEGTDDPTRACQSARPRRLASSTN